MGLRTLGVTSVVWLPLTNGKVWDVRNLNAPTCELQGHEGSVPLTVDLTQRVEGGGKYFKYLRSPFSAVSTPNFAIKASSVSVRRNFHEI